MKQRQRWPAELRAAIDAADAEGIAPSRIYAMVKSGELDGIDRGYPLPQSTFFDILAKLRQARLAVIEPVKPGEEEAAAGAILRRCIEIAKREVAKVDAQLSDPRKPASERATLTRTLDTLSKMVRSYEHKSASKNGGKSSQQRAGEASANKRSDPLSDMIRAKERELRSDSESVNGEASRKDGTASGEQDGRDAQNQEQPDNSNGQRDHLSDTRASVPATH